MIGFQSLAFLERILMSLKTALRQKSSMALEALVWSLLFVDHINMALHIILRAEFLKTHFALVILGSSMDHSHVHSQISWRA